MAKLSAKEYKARCKSFLKRLEGDSDVQQLDGGVFYRVINSGQGAVHPDSGSIVTVHYRGSLVDGREFDSTYGSYPESFRVREVIEGWQVALCAMTIGDKWEIYIPKSLGYGDKKSGVIPAGSLLIFEVELLGIS